MSDSVNSSSPPCYYPVFLDLRGKRCVVVGGGQVAFRKVEALVEAGAVVTVVAPLAVPMPAGVAYQARSYQPDDLAGAILVIAATDDPAVNADVARDAQALGIWVNVVDAPEGCSFILPSVVRRGALRIAVSTGGASPALARQLRRQLENVYGREYGELVELCGRLRQEWEPRAQAARLSAEVRRVAWETVLALPLLDLLRAGTPEAAASAARAVLESALNGRND